MFHREAGYMPATGYQFIRAKDIAGGVSLRSWNSTRQSSDETKSSNPLACVTDTAEVIAANPGGAV